MIMAMVAQTWKETPPHAFQGGAVAIGNFDGVHRGHAALVAALRAQSRAVEGPAVVVTFDPHPLQLLRPDQFQPVLTTLADRVALLESQGADHVLVLKTTPDLLHLGAEEFFQQVVRERLQARALVEGTNFAFGRDREGTIDTLGQLCAQTGLKLVVVPPFLIDGAAVSSSRVRGALLRGAVREARDLLGRCYRLRGIVRSGQRRGQTLGFPTANLDHVPTLVPGDGVYAVRVDHGERLWAGAANIGPNPTFGEQARKVEVHLIHFQGNLYGQPLAVSFVERLRDTKQFSSAEELIQQLQHDVDEARELAGW
jgi:riboflavin kinase/FMN adenylyltransferase